MSLETFVEDLRHDNIDEFRLEQKIRLYEKFVERIEDVISAYDEGQDIIKDLQYEVENLKEGLEEV